MVCFVLTTLGAIVTSAQTVQTFDFNGTNGGYPFGTPVQATDGNIYGGAFSLTNESTVFQLTPSGALTTLYTLCSTCGQGVDALLQGSDGNLYGLTSGGGSYNGGTAFQLTLSGTLTVLYDFCSIPGCIDGQSPVALVQGDDGNFYGVTQSGGNNKSGTVFKLTPSGTFTTVYSFCSQTKCPDGARPSTFILGSDGNFYGTTYDFGNGLYCSLTAGTCGTVFRITPTGTFTTVYGFCSRLNVAKTLRPVCTDGSSPSALVQGKDGNLYGTTYAGGVRGLPGEVGEGTAFQLTPSGTLTTLYSFCQLANCADGSDPGALVQASDGNFYGTTTLGGVEDDRYCTYGCGTFFQLTPGGVLTTGLYDFSRHNGVTPGGLMQASSGAFYGTARGGGGGCGCGTIWSWSANVALAPTFTPTSLNFTTQAVDTTSGSQGVFIKNVNTGNATLDFSNISVTGPFAISSNTCGTTLSAGHGCTVKVTFTPTTIGPASGILSVADNAPGSPQTVPLSGTGVAQATVTPTSLAFGNVRVGTTSVAKKVTLRNNLPTTLTGISISTVGPFSVSGSTCTTTLASKTSCTISVTFSPTTIGPASGTLGVTDSANNSPQTVSLSGTGS